MAEDFASYPITGVITPSDPDRRGRDGYQPRRQRPPAPRRPVPPPAEPLDPLTNDPPVPSHIGTRINVRV